MTERAIGECDRRVPVVRTVEAVEKLNEFGYRAGLLLIFEDFGVQWFVVDILKGRYENQSFEGLIKMLSTETFFLFIQKSLNDLQNNVNKNTSTYNILLFKLKNRIKIEASKVWLKYPISWYRIFKNVKRNCKCIKCNNKNVHAWFYFKSLW